MFKSLVLSSFVSLALVAGLALNASARAADAPEIRLAHALDDDKAEQLTKLVERFNATSKSGQITLVPYAERGTADLLLPPEEDETKIRASRGYKPLWEVMRDAQVPLDAFTQFPRMVVPAAVDERGRLLALPMTLSTPVVYVNRGALQQAGIDPDHLPKSWLDWQNELGKLASNRYYCPFTTTRPVQAFIDNTGAWNAQAAVVGNGKDEALAVNGLMHVKHLAMMITWYKANYLKLFGYADEAENEFVSGNCVVMVASSAAFPELQRRAKFEVGVGPFPYHDGAYGAPQNTLADGASLWAVAGRSAASYRTAAQFVRFFLAPENQVAWQVSAGYLPLNRSGVMTVTESSLLKADLTAQRIAIAQLTNKPVTVASSAGTYLRRAGVRRILQEELDAAWSGSKTAKQALDTAVMRARANEGGCCSM